MDKEPINHGETSLAIEVKNLSKHYGKKRVLNGLAMNVPAHSVYGFLGVNGAGKTTTFGLLSGFLPMEEGEVSVTGRLSILPQDAGFYHDRNILSQLKFLGLLSGIPWEKVDDEAIRVLELVGLKDLRKVKAEKLSHGMMKKLAIAQAFLGDPDIILLDEPTSGLDPKNIIEIRKLIIEMGKRQTLVISSHILSEITEMCDTVGILHEGFMKFEGPISKLTNSGSCVKYTITGTPSLSIFSGIAAVTLVDYLPEKKELVFNFNAGVLPVEAVNKKICNLLYKNNCGIKQIILGNSLEEGFLNLLK